MLSELTVVSWPAMANRCVRPTDLAVVERAVVDGGVGDRAENGVVVLLAAACEALTQQEQLEVVDHTLVSGHVAAEGGGHHLVGPVVEAVCLSDGKPEHHGDGGRRDRSTQNLHEIGLAHLGDRCQAIPGQIAQDLLVRLHGGRLEELLDDPAIGRVLGWIRLGRQDGCFAVDVRDRDPLRHGEVGVVASRVEHVVVAGQRPEPAELLAPRDRALLTELRVGLVESRPHCGVGVVEHRLVDNVFAHDIRPFVSAAVKHRATPIAPPL